MTLEVITATMGAEGWYARVAEWLRLATTRPREIVIDNREHNRGLLSSYQEGYEQSTADVLAFIHDDVVIYEEGWDARVLAEFDDPAVGIVGFGGALVHGSPDLYKTPYRLEQLGRSFYLSNVDDAEVHGERFDGSCDVAVLDGFALVVRRSLLDRVGGWPVGTPVGYSLYDYWLCCVAHRFGYRVRLVGVRCHHLGGLTAVGMGVAKGSGEAHVAAHRWLYDNFADVLPWDARGDN